MDNLTFVKAVLTKAEIGTGEDGAFVSLHFIAEYTEDVMRRIKWDDPGDSVKKADMTGPDELPGGNLVLTPEPEALKNSEVEFPFGCAEKFKLVTIIKKESKRREFRFIVVTPSKEAATHAFDYIQTIGKTPGTLKLSYSSQGDLPV